MASHNNQTRNSTDRSSTDRSGTDRSRPVQHNAKKADINEKPILKIIKIGGNIIDDENTLHKFLKTFAALQGKKLLVHGGGKLASKVADEMGLEVKMHQGRRITDEATLHIITMVYAGRINKNIVAQLQANNCNAIGFTGADGNTIESVKRPVKEVDYGFAGDIINVNTEILEVLLELKITPVFCAITHDQNGQLLNTNADTIASDLAVAFSDSFNVELSYIFEKQGVLEDVSDESSVIEEIDSIRYKKLKNDGKIVDGMIPKLDNCFAAIRQGVDTVKIGNVEMLSNKNSTFTTLKE